MHCTPAPWKAAVLHLPLRLRTSVLERCDIRPHLGLWLSLQPETPPVRKDEGTRCETCSWVTTSGFSHICLLSFITDTPSPLHSHHQVTTGSWSFSLSVDPAPGH